MTTQLVCHSEEPEATRNLALRLKRFRARFLAAVKMVNLDPLTRPAPAGECAVAGHPLPQGGEGILMTSVEPKAHGIFARNDRLRAISHRLPK